MPGLLLSLLLGLGLGLLLRLLTGLCLGLLLHWGLILLSGVGAVEAGAVAIALMLLNLCAGALLALSAVPATVSAAAASSALSVGGGGEEQSCREN